jgi:hypothetical protein
VGGDLWVAAMETLVGYGVEECQSRYETAPMMSVASLTEWITALIPNINL